MCRGDVSQRRSCSLDQRTVRSRTVRRQRTVRRTVPTLHDGAHERLQEADIAAGYFVAAMTPS